MLGQIGNLRADWQSAVRLACSVPYHGRRALFRLNNSGPTSPLRANCQRKA
jgi:hypothetical protein